MDNQPNPEELPLYRHALLAAQEAMANLASTSSRAAVSSHGLEYCGYRGSKPMLEVALWALCRGELDDEAGERLRDHVSNCRYCLAKVQEICQALLQSTQPCGLQPTPDELRSLLVRYAAGKLGEHEEAEVGAHADSCPYCLRVLAELVESGAELSKDFPTFGPQVILPVEWNELPESPLLDAPRERLVATRGAADWKSGSDLELVLVLERAAHRVKGATGLVEVVTLDPVWKRLVGQVYGKAPKLVGEGSEVGEGAGFSVYQVIGVAARLGESTVRLEVERRWSSLGGAATELLRVLCEGGEAQAAGVDVELVTEGAASGGWRRRLERNGRGQLPSSAVSFDLSSLDRVLPGGRGAFRLLLFTTGRNDPFGEARVEIT